MGITYMPSMALLSQYFVRRRALAIGIAVSVKLFSFDVRRKGLPTIGHRCWGCDSPNYA